ncbi:MAG: histidine--tRNA ligase [Desulfovibrionaceae bacterium]|nr:histidine--tRNA ligase [Desulfovibrionaceae bacterium]
MSAITKIKGFADLFPPDSTAMLRMESAAREVFGRHGYQEIRTPILEKTELFARSIGEETDVVQKEMYTFPDRKGRSLTMRPEATAGVLRAYVENKVYARETVSKLFTFGPMFRYERPQKGRMRQFHQLNCELLGAEEPHADAEVVVMLWDFLGTLGIPDLALELNSLGCRECRPAYHEALKAFLAGLDTDALCEDCRRRMHTNPLRVLDCKVPTCKALVEDAPKITDHLCAGCADHFAAVREVLDGANVAYTLNPRLVRGLDYYVRTTFEVVSGAIGAQSAVAGGGRYDGLIAQLGGPDAPGIGFACGMERLALLLPPVQAARPDFYVAVLDPAGLTAGMLLAKGLRDAGLGGECAFAAKSMKSQMRAADKAGARACLLLGGDELAVGTVVIKNMATGGQRSVSRADVAEVARAVREAAG